MTDVLKLIYLDQDNINKIIVFFGDKGNELKESDIATMFINDHQNPLFEGVFSKAELETVVSKKMIVHFTKQFIYIDDTIETIKKKIMVVFANELSTPISFDEIYLFSKQIQTLNISRIYDSLTQNGKLTLTQDLLFQFLSNINDINISDVPIKDMYTFNDIIDLNIADKKQLVNISLGHRFIIGENIYSFAANPFKANEFDKILRSNADNIITTTNKDLLLSNGFLFENTIYVCLAEDVFKYAVSKNLTETTTCKVYYPFLSGKQIYNLTRLREKKYELLEENTSLLGSNFIKHVNNIRMFHDIYNTKKSELNYIEQGIQTVDFVISHDFEFNVPLEIIFKLIHATKRIPLIKLNPAKRQEKIYKLYCNKTAKNGKKIPYLSKSLIFKLAKTLGTSKHVSCYMEYNENNSSTSKMIPIILEFDTLANIHVKAEFKETKNVSDIEEIIGKAINPVIEVIRNYLATSGYSMNLFNSFYDKNVEIISLKYISYISIDKNINLNNLLGCVSSVFNVLVGDLKSGIVMRYKRVSNFNEMDSQEAFIVELLNRANEDEDIVKLLMDNFQLSESDAQLKIADLLNSLQMVQTLNKRRKLKIKNNPGFLTKITQDAFKQNIMIEMDNINDINYMHVVPIYIDSLIRITQTPETSSVDLSTIDGLCKTKQIDDVEQINDIVAPSEKGFNENVPTAIIAENLTFGEPASNVRLADRTINVLDFLYENDSDEEGGDESSVDEDEGIDVELDEPSAHEDEGIDIEFDESSADEDEGITVELDEPSAEIDIELDEPSADEDNDNLLGGTASNDVSVLKNKSSDRVKKPVKLTIRENDNLEKDITGMRIADPNPFFKAMREKDPTLFLTESDGKYSAYSRVCPWNKRRQPVILTEEEKNRIDREHPGSYNGNAIKYGSDPNNQYWYICPRYWDLKNNTSLTEEEAKSGKYGGIIPQDAKTAPVGKNIWEFNEPAYHVDKNGNYIDLSPGFLKKDIHPDGLQVPCCFKIWKDPAKNLTDAVVLPKQDVDEYIKGPDKFPIEENRFGYLPFIVQKFIDTDNKTCQISATNKNLKKDQPCYLRKGPENSKNKSFVACIADVYSEQNDNVTLTINEFINNKLINMLTADTFVSLQNGSLISEFQSPNMDDINNTSVENIRDTAIYLKLKNSNTVYLKRIVSALQNFIEFLKAPRSHIDYTYLWDLICQPNDLLFKKGVNLVILNLPQDDTTANINIICPTNYYSISKYDPTKDTMLIMQKYEYFEPIYIVVDQSKTNIVSIATTKLYTPSLMTKIPNLNTLANTIQDIYRSMCKPMPSLPKVFKYKEIKFKRNVSLEQSIAILNKYKFTIQSLVVNYDDKVIGLNIENDQMAGFIPCFPSGIISSYELVDLENDERLMNLEETIQFLKAVSVNTNGEILCKPVVKIVEDKLIVGVLTETNQFIALIEPELNTDQSIKHTIDDENFVQVDKIIQTSNEVDKSREEYVKKIHLETELYTAFRNKLRTLINNFKNKKVRDEMETISMSVNMIYYLQLEKMILLIKNLMTSEVEFVPVTPQNIKHIESNLKDGDILMIPKSNLLSNLDNEEIYYSKLADELIRYNRVKQFMFKPKMFLSFTDLKYNLSSDEIILLQSLLTNEYFDDLVPDLVSKYISFNSYDTTEPSVSQKYDNEYVVNDIDKDRGNVGKPILNENELLIENNKNMKALDKFDNSVESVPQIKPFKIYNNCPVEKKDVFAKLKMKFRGGYKDIIFSSNTPECTFDVALTLINNTISVPIDINGIKQGLIQKYQELLTMYPMEIVNVFDYYGFIAQSKELATNRLSIENLIMSETYYITNFDLMMISDIYDIPITLIAPRVYRENNNEYLSINIKKGYTYIIRTSGVNKYKHVLPKFKMIINKMGDGLLEIRNLPEQTIRDEIISQKNNIIDLLKTYAVVIQDELESIVVEPMNNIEVTKPANTKLKLKTRKLKLVEM